LLTLNGGNTEGLRAFAVEPEAGFVEIARDFVELAGLSDIVTVVKGFSGEFSRTLKSEHGIEKIDVHWEESYLPDLHLAEELGFLHQGSLILADNTDVRGAPGYLEYVRSSKKTSNDFFYEPKTLDTRVKPEDPERSHSIGITSC
jgi:catechol O-methyltransferase